MAGEKYRKYVKELSFQNDGPGFYRQVTELSGAPFGLDFHVRYGAYWAPGYMGEEPYRPHKHDYNQVMLWLGTDATNLGELGAEVELYLGEEGEKHMITSSTAVTVPAGLVHFPANITRMNRRFVFMTLSCTRECREITLPELKRDTGGPPVVEYSSKYRDNIVNLAFTRKGAWTYGPLNPDDSGGMLSFIRSQNPEFNYLIMYESIINAPYRFGPEPDKPHQHPGLQISIFMGTDPNDLSSLGGEVEYYLGEEMEKYVITRPTAVVVPDNFPHCPLVITRVDRPIILCDIRPFGTAAPAPAKT